MPCTILLTFLRVLCQPLPESLRGLQEGGAEGILKLLLLRGGINAQPALPVDNQTMCLHLLETGGQADAFALADFWYSVITFAEIPDM